MFDFFRRQFSAGHQSSPSLGGNGIVIGLPGEVVAVNLERCWWAFEGHDGSRHVLRSAAGREIFGDDEHIGELRAKFLRMGQESHEVQLLARAMEVQSPVVVLFPAKPVIRGEAIDILEEFLKRRFKVDSSAFNLIKIYTAPVRRGGEKFCRKFRGSRGSQVMLNLSGEGLKYLHYDPNEKDVVVDALEPDWPTSWSPESLAALAERRIRGMDPGAFRRMREAIESGLLLVYLPEQPDQRRPILGSSALLLGQAPGGEIDLGAPAVLRWSRTSAAAER